MSPAPDLRVFLDQLRAGDELIEIHRATRTDGEISAIVKEVEPAGAPAVLFHNVVGSDLPVVAGVFGTRSRIASAVGQPQYGLLEHALTLIEEGGPAPVTVARDVAPVQQIVQDAEDVELARLPFGVHSKDDAGTYITSGVVLARDDLTGTINTGMYRMMITGRRTLTVNAAPDHDLGRVIARARAAGRPVEIAIVIGHHPAYAIASQLKNPTSVDTHELVGALLGAPLRVTPGATVDLPIPADAEIVLEGRVDPTNMEAEGPFGEFSYYYGSAQAPVCTVTAVTRRADAIFHDLHPTHAEHRCLWLFPGREARLLQAVRRSVPGVRDVRIPFMGGSLSAYIQVEKQKQADGTQAILAALASDHFIKHVYVVDEDIDIHDDQQVLWALNVRFQAGRDLMVLPNQKGIRMDPSARRVNPESATELVTDKLGFDATRPFFPAFPDRADRPVAAYADVNLASFLDENDLDRVQSWLSFRQGAGE
ncbi:UbiD family decarboxylase [Ornithinimicrobium cavernae]|uniref:UbiD family decarboxylase n=1 Tax=Ornithinimicrobium cavernae TaxID=2666047 RepID=UPI000D68888F|nr:UbiD family decarboxylase [Ornithinimicrobium cavernae]